MRPITLTRRPMTTITLAPDEILALTGCRRTADQLRALHAAGFVRARIGRTGAVILERAHYDAVAAGQFAVPPAARHTGEPTLRPVRP